MVVNAALACQVVVVAAALGPDAVDIVPLM